jgi:excisionase family DNA binding protein
MSTTDNSRPGGTIEDQIEAAVERALQRMLGPYLAKLCAPEPAVYTVAHTAVVMQVSEDTVARLVKRGVLPRVPHLDGKILIPRAAVQKLVSGEGEC